MRRDVALTGIFCPTLFCFKTLSFKGTGCTWFSKNLLRLAFFHTDHTCLWGAARMHTGPEVAGCRSSFKLLSIVSSYICLLYCSCFSSCTIDQLAFCLHFLNCRPVVVTFSDFKDREEVNNFSILPKWFWECSSKNMQQVLRKAAMLKGSSVYVTEDLSRWSLDLFKMC